MDIILPKDKCPNPVAVLRSAGYGYSVDPVTKEDSWMIRLTAGLYPRFHLYVEDRGDKVKFSLHLDQKKASYGGNHAHNAEYDGKLVAHEILRLESWIRAGNR